MLINQWVAQLLSTSTRRWYSFNYWISNLYAIQNFGICLGLLLNMVKHVFLDLLLICLLGTNQRDHGVLASWFFSVQWQMSSKVAQIYYCKTCKVCLMKFSWIWSSRHFYYTFGEPAHSGDHASHVCFKIAWVVQSYDGITFCQLKSHLFIQEKNQSTLYLYTLRLKVW